MIAKLDALSAACLTIATILFVVWVLHMVPHVTQALYGEPRVIIDVPAYGGE